MKCELIEHKMINLPNLEMKDKAWRSAGASPVLSNMFCWFAAPSGLFLKNKKLCEPTKQDPSGGPMCAA